MSFYEHFAQLCKQRNIKPTRAALDMGLSKSLPNKWKTTDAKPSGETLKKIADYFGVSADDLLDDDPDIILHMTLELPAITPKDMQIALLGHTVDDETWDKIVDHSREIASSEEDEKHSELVTLEEVKRRLEELNAIIELQTQKLKNGTKE